MCLSVLFIASATIAILCHCPATAGQIYDPSRSTGTVTTKLSEFQYGERSVPLKLYLPDNKNAAPVILLSHGLGGTREVGAYLGKHWAGRGYVVVAMQHAGSDFEVVRNARLLQKFSALKKAANAENAQARFHDVRETIDHITALNQGPSVLAGRFDLSRIGMSGHSFGAVTTQAVSGQRHVARGKNYTDERIKAAFAMSPSPPAVTFGQNVFDRVQVPWLLMTGTQDESPIGRKGDPESRREVFRSLPLSGHFYELCLEGAEHSAFGDTAQHRKSRNPKHHPAILAISSAFWDAYLTDNSDAKSWLSGKAVRSVLEPADEWLTK